MKSGTRYLLIGALVLICAALAYGLYSEKREPRGIGIPAGSKTFNVDKK